MNISLLRVVVAVAGAHHHYHISRNLCRLDIVAICCCGGSDELQPAVH